MIGKTISHYKILEKLGGGGMGVVYKAQDLKLDRFVALKFLPHHLSADEEEKKRFIHEAKAASALDHPNICVIHEIDETEDGQLFIVMAYYEGETLKKKVGSDQLSVDSVVDIATQIAQGLTKAHEHGITHRDIKPANVMITKDGVAKILDFGLAKLAGQPRLTKTGSTLGTMAYMSPEQARGEEVDHRTDIWALGVVLYEMITGRLPFKGEYEHAVMYSILNEDPKPITSLHPDVPITLERIVKKALAKRAAERYQRTSEMLTDLCALRKVIESSSAKKPTSNAMLKNRKRSFLYAGVAGLIILLIGIGLYLLQHTKPATTINSIAVLPLTNLSSDPEQEYFADGMTEALISVLGQIQALRVISRTSVMQYRGGTKPLPVIAQELNVDAVVEGSTVSSGDRVSITVRLIEAKTEKRLWSQSFERELRDVLNLQREIALAITQQIEVRVTGQERAHLQEARAVDPEAYKLYLWGQHFVDIGYPEDFQRAVNFFEQAIERDPDFAKAYAAMAVPYYMLGGVVGLMPRKDSEFKAKQAAAKALELDENLSEAHAARATLREIYDWDWAGAEEEFKRAIELKPNSATAHYEYGMLLCRTGRGQEGITEIMRALDLDPLSHSFNGGLAWAYVVNRQYDKAIEYCRKFLQLNPGSAWVQYYLGLAYLAKRQYQEASAIYEKKEMTAFLGLDGLGYLGHAYALTGKRDKALKLLDELQKGLERGEETGIFISWIYIGLGEKDKALVMLERACEQHDSNLFHQTLDPLFDPLRAEPRFQAVLKKMGLEK